MTYILATTVPLTTWTRLNRHMKCRQHCKRCEYTWQDTKTENVRVVQPQEPGAKQEWWCDFCYESSLLTK